MDQRSRKRLITPQALETLENTLVQEWTEKTLVRYIYIYIYICVCVCVYTPTHTYNNRLRATACFEKISSMPKTNVTNGSRATFQQL